MATAWRSALRLSKDLQHLGIRVTLRQHLSIYCASLNPDRQSTLSEFQAHLKPSFGSSCSRQSTRTMPTKPAPVSK